MGTPIVIAGMHRSGTSLLANLFQEAGLDLGSRLLDASPSNAKGHFEDLDFKNLHDEILGGNIGLFVPPRGGRALSTSQRRKAEELVDARRDREIWGWKDPRTTLFLDLWDELLPEALWVFIFREPSLVLDSLRKRKADRSLFRYWRGFWVCHRLFGLNRFRVRRAMDAWVWHNRLVLEFMDRQPERSVLIDLDHLEEDFPLAVTDLRERFGVAFSDIALDAILDRSLQSKAASEDIARPCAANREMQDLFAELKRRATYAARR